MGWKKRERGKCGGRGTIVEGARRKKVEERKEDGKRKSVGSTSMSWIDRCRARGLVVRYRG